MGSEAVPVVFFCGFAASFRVRSSPRGRVVPLSGQFASRTGEWWPNSGWPPRRLLLEERVPEAQQVFEFGPPGWQDVKGAGITGSAGVVYHAAVKHGYERRKRKVGGESSILRTTRGGHSARARGAATGLSLICAKASSRLSRSRTMATSLQQLGQRRTGLPRAWDLSCACEPLEIFSQLHDSRRCSTSACPGRLAG